MQCRFNTRSGGEELGDECSNFLNVPSNLAQETHNLYSQHRVVVTVNNLLQADLSSECFRQDRVHQMPATACCICQAYLREDEADR